MAEKYINIKNVIGSGSAGKVALTDLALEKKDLAEFSKVLTAYIQSGEFAADLGDPSSYRETPSNYNIIPYFDSFENYLDKDISGPTTGTITLCRGIQKAYNGSVCLKIMHIGPSTKFLHPDSDTNFAWMTIGETPGVGEGYYFSGYFWFAGQPNANTRLKIIKWYKDENGIYQQTDLNGITITPTQALNAVDSWYRFVSPVITPLLVDDIITFKYETDDTANIPVYIDALQLEIATSAAEIKPFIRSGAVITDGTNIRVGSIKANAIAANVISVDKLVPNIGDTINISGNLSIESLNAATPNLIPYIPGEIESGTINGSGGNEASTTWLRTINYIPIKASTKYQFKLSTSLSITSSAVYYYNASQVFIGVLGITDYNLVIETPANTAYIRVAFQRSDKASFPVTDMANHKIGLYESTSLLSGTYYTFDGNGATIRNGQLTIKNNADVTVFSADVNGNLSITGNITATSGTFNGSIYASSGRIGGIEIGNYSISAGSGSSFVGMRSSGNTAFYAGATTNSNPTVAQTKFSVTHAGVLKATSGTIGSATFDVRSGGGLNIDNVQISSGLWVTGNSIVLSSTIQFSSNALYDIGTPSYRPRMVYANNITTGDVSYTGNAYPYSDTFGTVGKSTNRWASVWAVDGSINTSDARMKDNIKQINNGVDLILNLEPVQYTWKNGSRIHYGFIAQDVKNKMLESNIPDAALYVDPSIKPDWDTNDQELNNMDHYVGLRYHELIAPMVQTIQNLNERIKVLEEKSNGTGY